MIYSQKIKPTDHGFIKDYYLADGDKVLMSQTIHYRTYSFAEALDLLGSVGFTYQADSHRMNGSRKFLEFNKA
jgi:cystathionine beta-lyase/cystathionine gamma-synthase